MSGSVVGITAGKILWGERNGGWGYVKYDGYNYLAIQLALAPDVFRVDLPPDPKEVAPTEARNQEKERQSRFFNVRTRVMG